jgi:hypothetical protein
MRLRIDIDAVRVTAGDTIGADIVVLEGAPARALRAWLELVERVGNRTHAGRVESETTIGDGPLSSGDVMRLALRLPADAQPDLETEVGSLYWDLVVSVDRPLRPDLVERVTLVVDAP